MSTLEDLVIPIDTLSDEELRQRLFEVRQRRETIRPAAKKHKEKSIKAVKKKESKKKLTAAEKVLGELTSEQLALLLQELGQ